MNFLHGLGFTGRPNRKARDGGSLVLRFSSRFGRNEIIDTRRTDPIIQGVEGPSSWSVLRYGLGALWLIDALLQMQPGMFHPAFYGNLPSNVMPSVLQVVKEGTAPWVTPALDLTQTVFKRLPAVTNLFIMATQLVLGGLLLLPRSGRAVRLAALLSVFWGCIVWLFGEGLGGLFSLGDMNFYEGFPGPAFLYAAAGLFLCLPTDLWQRGVVQRAITRFVAGVFAVSTVLQGLPANGQWGVKGLLDVFANSGFQTQPSFFAAPIMGFTAMVSTHPIATNLVLLLMLALATGLVLRWTGIPSLLRLWVFVWLGWTWWFGQDFGYLFSGLSTDPNTAPILAVLLLTVTWSGRPVSLPKQKS